MKNLLIVLICFIMPGCVGKIEKTIETITDMTQPDIVVTIVVDKKEYSLDTTAELGTLPKVYGDFLKADSNEEFEQCREDAHHYKQELQQCRVDLAKERNKTTGTDPEDDFPGNTDVKKYSDQYSHINLSCWRENNGTCLVLGPGQHFDSCSIEGQDMRKHPSPDPGHNTERDIWVVYKQPYVEGVITCKNGEEETHFLSSHKLVQGDDVYKGALYPGGR